jgi:tetratricopeptide (TPR) repeat protein
VLGFFDEAGYSHYYIDESLKKFKKVMEMDQTMVDFDFYYYQGLAKAEMPVRIGWFTASKECRTKEAIADIEQAIIMDNSKVHYYSNLAHIYMKQGLQDSDDSFSQAVILYKKASDIVKNEDDKQFLISAMVTAARLGNIHIDEEYADIEPFEAEKQNNQITGKDILSGLWGLAKKGMENVQKEYTNKTAMIEKYKNKYQNYSKQQLAQILQNSNVFEEKAAAKHLLQEKE